MILDYIIDFAIVALLIIGITATMGVLLNGIGERVFGGKGHKENYNQSAHTQIGWKSVGGKSKR